jgi:hypothetical protein
VVEFDSKTKNHNSLYKCICECGKEGIVKDSNLRTGKSKQCKSCATKINGRKGLDAQSKKHLYFIRCGDYIKIGSTDNVERRIKDLANANPYPVEIIKVMLNQGYLESKYHEQYRDKRIHGEWFNMKEID